MNQPSEPTTRRGAELTVVVPTYNEADNIEALYHGLRAALSGIEWELLVVDDDSPDGTSGVARKLAETDGRVRVLQRVGRRGLSSACIEGMLASASPFVAVMDGDLQHDERLLPEMLATLRQQQADIAVGSRSVGDGSFGAMDKNRVKISKFATWLTKRIGNVDLEDPMSGYFMLTRAVIERVHRRLYGQGFKILLDICAHADPDTRIVELPYAMRDRSRGESKLSPRVVLEFAVFLTSNLLGRIVPPRMIKFFMVGLSGVAVHMTVLGLLYRFLDFRFLTAQIVATCCAIASNFVLNNRYTFEHQRLRGRRFWTGLGSFYLVCAIGAVIGVAVGELLHRIPVAWWLAGFATTVVAALWNYSVSSILTWGRPARRA